MWLTIGKGFWESTLNLHVIQHFSKTQQSWTERLRRTIERILQKELAYASRVTAWQPDFEDREEYLLS